VIMERLKIILRESEIKSGHSRRSLAEILSKPVALDLLSLDRREKTIDELHAWSIWHGRHI
jgi:hypothetical protein